jgi:hypothetical protein
MSQAVAAPARARTVRASASDTGRTAATRRDAFPHTKRPLPWLLAGFMALVFLVPIQQTELKLHLPVDSTPDRFAVIGLLLAWFWFGGDQRAFLRSRRPKLFVFAACVFVVVAVASVLFDAPRIINLGEFPLVEKRFALLGSFVVVCWFALTALRFEDLRGFITYLIWLAVLMSIGMIIERRTGYNVFYEGIGSLLRPIATVAKSPTDLIATPANEGRVTVVGPTDHGLAATAVLVMVLPFAIVRVIDATSRRSWWLNGAAVTLIVVAAAATDRKTALLVPLALVMYITWYRPRQMLRLLPLGLIIVGGVVHFAAPGTLGRVLNVHEAVNSGSTEHREGDFATAMPDVLAHPLLGRGYGSLDSQQPTQFRINDDQYIDEVTSTGILGLLAFIGMILAPVVMARRAIRTRGPTVASTALAASAACVAFLVVSALFDSIGFIQAPYIFFVMAALTTVAVAGPEGNVASSLWTSHEQAVRRAIPAGSPAGA